MNKMDINGREIDRMEIYGKEMNQKRMNEMKKDGMEMDGMKMGEWIWTNAKRQKYIEKSGGNENGNEEKETNVRDMNGAS